MAFFDKERQYRIGERDTLGFEFYGDDLPTGVTVQSGTVAVSPATGLTLDSATAVVTTEEDGLYAWATGVTAGEYYVTFTVTFSDGKILPRVYRVFIPDPTLSTDNILTIEEAKAHLKSDSAADESMIESAIEAVSARFANNIGTLSLRKKTYTSTTLDSPGKRYLHLPAWPIVSITSLTEDGVALTENTHYYADYATGVVERVGSWTTTYSEETSYSNGRWIDKRKAIVITYVAGYDISGTVTLPYALKHAALNEVGREVQRLQHKLFGEESRSTDGGSSTFNTDEFMKDTLETLRHYRRLRI